MKKYSTLAIFSLMLFALVFISPRLSTQQSRLTKVGYLNIDEVNEAMMSDTEISNILKEKALLGDVKKEIQKYIAMSMLAIVKREGYTLILDRNEVNVLYADRNFDITSQVIAQVRELIKKSDK